MNRHTASGTCGVCEDVFMTRAPSPHRSGALPRPTIRDIATAAGVSKSLVSLAFKDASRVSPKRRELILNAANDLGYQPNFLARSLATDGAPFVAILLVNLHNPIFAEIADSVRATLDANGEYGMITTATMPDVESRADHYGQVDPRVISMLRDLRPRALVVVGTVVEHEPLLNGIPTVYASAAPRKGSGYSAVHVDDTAGVDAVVEHLVEQDHERIAFIGGQGGAVSKGREQAYLDTMTSRGLATQVAPAGFSEEEGYQAAKELLKTPEPPTAIVAVNDMSAIGALTAADEAGLSVPGDVAIAGFDNIPLAKLQRISLTTVDPQNQEIGRLAAHSTLERLTDPDSAATEHLIAPRLVIRDSTLTRD